MTKVLDNASVVKAYRSLLNESKDWSHRFSTPAIRGVLNRLFNLDALRLDYSNEEYALALIRSDPNAIACIPEAVWEKIKDDADNILTLQRVGGTMPHNTEEIRFCLVVDEGWELLGWQPLALVLAAGAVKIEMYTMGSGIDGDDSWDITFFKDVDKEIDLDYETWTWNINDWLLDLYLCRNVSLTVNIDILKLSVTCEGEMAVRRPFAEKMNISNKNNLVRSVDDILVTVEKKLTT
jgi:hypothetical protein